MVAPASNAQPHWCAVALDTQATVDGKGGLGAILPQQLQQRGWHQYLQLPVAVCYDLRHEVCCA